MSTNSHIRVLCTDGKVREIYVHMDGDKHLSTLQKHYNSQELAEGLIVLGNLSILDESMDCPEGHSFRKPVRGFCVAYYRDRGDPWKHSNSYEFDTFEEAWHDQNKILIEYVYEWHGQETGWIKIKTSEGRKRE